MKRPRTWILALCAAAALIAGAWWLGLPGALRGLLAQPAPAEPVKVLILAIDTLRGDHVNLPGGAAPRTPNIDALAAAGTRFARCRTTAPWTGPSFASLYTGLLPYHHGFYNREFYSLAPERTTMAEHFAAAGYRTAAFVTVAYLTHAYGMAQGFQAGDKFTDQGRGEEARLVTGSGIGFARMHADEPFFLLLHYFDVHAPYTPPAPWDRMYYDGDPYAPGAPLLEGLLDPSVNMLADRPDIYAWLEGVTDPAYPPAQYAAGVSYVDDHVGRVVADLEARGLYDDMLIVLVADHGEHLGEHGVYYGHALPYEEVLHVPLIVKWPQGRHAGTVVEQRVTLMDVLPTVLETAGLPVPDGLDGRSLVDLAAGRTDRSASLLVAEQGESREQFCKTIVDGDWKLMLFFVDGEYRPVLFDLARDPRELRNVAVQHPEVVERLTARLWEIFDPENPLQEDRQPSQTPLSEEERRRLRSLGYID